MITKRKLGLIFIALGGPALVGLLAMDWLRASEFQGFGPAQTAAMAGAVLLVIVGITLLPLGDRPA